jgi:hypothetical protein
MLNVYVLPSGKSNADVARTLETFNDLAYDVTRVYSTSEINEVRKTKSILVNNQDRYFVIYDNECLTEDLAKVLPVFLQSGFDVLVVYKKAMVEGKLAFSKSPRIFRDGVRLKKNCLLPANRNLKITAVLDAWLCEHEVTD